MCESLIGLTMSELKLFFSRTLSDWMSVMHSLSLCSVIDLIESFNLHAYGPRLYTPCICGRFYFFDINKDCITYKINNKKLCDCVVRRFYEIRG